MVIREDLVASAAQFLQDPSVATSSTDSKIAFLQSKNLTQEEVQAALARSSGQNAPPPPPAAYYGSNAGYPGYGWHAPPPEPQRRDWRDWFVMATVVAGVGYGMYSFGKRYVYPLIAPPTPERLETDKKAVDDQFEKAFALVEQLAKDTETLKAAEQERTERLDTALADLENVIGELKSANRRREDEAQRVREEVQGLKTQLPKALERQKDVTDERLQEVNKELVGLKTLLSQRLKAGSGTESVTNGVPATSSKSNNSPFANAQNLATEGSAKADGSSQDTSGIPSPFAPLKSAANVKIPDWQRAMATKRTASPAVDKTEEHSA